MTPTQAAWRAIAVSPSAGRQMLATDSDPWTEWARAVCTMAMGDYAGAFHRLRPIAAEATEVAGLAAAALASGLRQLDEHAAAVAWDERAMAGPAAARLDGLIGRAADDVGLLDPGAAAGWLQLAEPLQVTWRDRIRYHWVATEVALSLGELSGAVVAADRALAAARRTGSPRHLLKSALFRAVCEVQTEVRVRQVREVLDAAEVMSLPPLVWPAVVVIGDRARPREQRAGAEATAFIRDHLPPGVGGGWLARSDVSGLLAG